MILNCRRVALAYSEEKVIFGLHPRQSLRALPNYSFTEEAAAAIFISAGKSLQEKAAAFPHKYVYGSRFSVLTSTSSSGRAARSFAAAAAVPGNLV